jgi:hypothetical protein
MPTAAQHLIDTLSGDMPDLLRPIKVQKRCASAGPILQVKSSSVTVPVYRCGDGRLPRFFIAYYRNGQRVRQSFSTIDEAKREAQVAALDAGNSPTIIFKHYRELATEEQANEWFGIFPLPPVLSAF